MMMALVCTVGCKENVTPEPGRPWADGEQTIAYTVDREIGQTTLRSDADWDGLMERLLNCAEEGKAVSLYNADRSAKAFCGQADAKSTAGTRTNQTLNTTSREEMKAWCRKMELEGKTVTVVYNKDTGVWSGTAYVLGPRETPPQIADDLYYYNEYGNRVQCQIDTTTVFVAMSELADSVLLRQLMAIGDAIQIYSNIIIIENIKVPYTTLQTMLLNSGQLELLSPSIERRVYPLHEVVVSVKEDRMGDFRHWLQENGLSVYDSVPQLGEYVVSSGSCFGLNTVRLAAEMYELGMFYGAVPSLLEVQYIPPFVY